MPGQSWSGGTFSKSQHRQPEFDPRIDAQKIVLTLTLTLTLTLAPTLTITLTSAIALAGFQARHCGVCVLHWSVLYCESEAEATQLVGTVRYAIVS